LQLDNFYDLCPPLSLTSVDKIGSIKLLGTHLFIQEIEGEEVQITRFLGICQKSPKDLKIFLKLYESFLKKKDHRALGPQLNLFHLSEQIGLLGVIWHPKGMELQRILLEWLDRQIAECEPQIPQISTPFVVRRDFLPVDSQTLEPFLFQGAEYALRSSPLCQHLEFLHYFSLEQEELPWRMTEYASIYRQYPEAQWWGLFCRSSYLTDYTTICCLREQVISELISSLHFIEQIITIFGFEAQWILFASRQKSPKARQEQEAIGWLKQAIQTQPRLYPFSSDLHEEEEGEGPALELRVRDVLGREWPVSRLSVARRVKEFAPRFAEQAEEQRRVILTRSIWGSLDRFIALLIEHYEGVFPLWLAPEQVWIIVIGEANRSYAEHVTQQLRHKGLRVKLDIRKAKLNVRVHEAEKENIPYVVLIGDRERIKQKISVRLAGKFNQNQTVEIETFLHKLYQESLCPTLIESIERLKSS
jgi:threonyl-tRNA synthetase